MPQKIICGKCGVVLYEGLELESPNEVIQRNNGTCPSCGKKLNYNHDYISIEGNML